MPYLNVVLAKAMYRQNRSVGVRNIHLPSGWLLNTRRVSVPPVSRHGREQREEIRCRRAILSQDLR
jgi:hypothetical protein